MCGICGIINPNGVRQEEIQRMVSILEHRGPDDEGIYVNKTLGFGHRRLSIIDLDSGQQPMCNEDGNVWITFNGEIYNYKEIRRDLEKRHEFKTKSDTEVILHLYEEEKEKCLDYLRGMFAFAIYDLQEKKLFIARDHLGQKPLYYFHNENGFAFASEIKALLELDANLRELDPNALYEYLTIRIITSPRSMFKNIRKLPPGHFLTFQNNQISINRYWSLKFNQKLEGDFVAISHELEKMIKSTIKYHLTSDVPVGAFLSGGMDSSLIVAMMAKIVPRPVLTFSGDVSYQNYSEIPDARMVAEKYNTAHHELTINPSLVQTLPETVWHLDEPSDPLSVCVFSLSALTRKYVKVVLGGDGGDELFGGYDRYYGNVLASYYAMIPEVIRKIILKKIIDQMPEGFWYRSLSHQLRWMHQISFHKAGTRYAKSLSYFYFSDDYKHKLYTDKFRNNVVLFDPEECIKSYFESHNANDVIDKMLYADSMTRMPDHPNMILDRMTMAHGLEARSPFLDHKLAEFCARIPRHFKVRGRKLRHIEAELAKKYLPTELITKKKQGFSSALPYILEQEYNKLFDVLLRDSRLVNSGYFNHSAINRLIREHKEKRADHGYRLWLMCNAEVWYRMHIDNESVESLKNAFAYNNFQATKLKNS